MEYDFLTWLGHASFMINANGLNIFIDPYRIGGISEKADIIFITHAHRDHFSEEDIAKIAKEGTKFVGPKEVIDRLGEGIVVKPGSKGEVLGIRYEAVAAYNTDPEKLEFHKKESAWVGFVVEANGKRIYHPGDTDRIDEMKKVHADLALLPCGGKYTMDIDEAILASRMIDAKSFAPMHYKSLLGEEKAKELEKKFLENVKNGIILKERREA
ncbi:MAG: MBL fold metallo-hydrolase [Candidatus Micrarchaeota archaeon]|nr:MBL fold metallo-hydrolase [Candidatus Micrarchaeota archaeon]